MRRQFLLTATPRGDGHRDEAGSAGAVDVLRRVAEDKNILGFETDPVPLHRPRMCHRPQLVAVHMVVGEGTKFKKIPNPVMGQFELGSPLDIAGQQTEHNVLPPVQRLEQAHNAGQDFSLPPR